MCVSINLLAIVFVLEDGWFLKVTMTSKKVMNCASFLLEF
jgi:hypothetical protein